MPPVFFLGGHFDPWAGTLSSRPEVLPGSDSNPVSLRGIPRTLPIRQKLTSLDRTGGNLYMDKSRILPTGGFFLPVPVLVAFPTSTGVLPVLSTFLRGALRALHPPCSELGGDYTLPSARGGLPRIVTREVLPDEGPAEQLSCRPFSSWGLNRPLGGNIVQSPGRSARVGFEPVQSSWYTQNLTN